ncbi:cell division protein FtsQ [Prauserella shujinwangii]|uniref:Cell division protein FtsQ n=1 Tax=Prauserella shujinwangii TaxID=1453103 RepID=A0A2T0LS84_9PSEU|nr:FtsQ-type POTRA domain-containing protein [Prauserella shujinwangii]PRX46483.1 cell division protein FtsQ [Prauserella shujinwangii]
MPTARQRSARGRDRERRDPGRTRRDREQARARDGEQRSGRDRAPVRHSERGRRSARAREQTRAAPSRRKALRRRWVAALSLLTVAGLAYVLLFTSLLGVRSVEVVGARTVNAERIREVARVPDRQPMLRVDTDAIRDRVATLNTVATVEVSRSWPSTLEITVTERTPIGFYDTGETLHLVDPAGVVYKRVDERPSGLPELTLPRVGPDDPATRAVTAVLSGLPPELADRVVSAGARTPGSVEFTLRGGKVVRWGDVTQAERKAKVLAVLLTRKGTTYDVSSPELPTVS